MMWLVVLSFKMDDFYTCFYVNMLLDIRIVAQATITLQLLRHGHLTPLYRIGRGLWMCIENQNSCFKALFVNYSLMIF
jgi:hypothetical protein